MRPRRRALLGAPALAFPALAFPALAQPRFPSRPIRMICPFAPGGDTDRQMRAICEGAARRLGVQVVLENRSGGSAILGATALANDRAADGHLLSQMPTNVFSLPLRMRQPPFNPLTDFTWIIQLVGYAHGLAVRADSPFQTLPELLAYAKDHPGKVSIGTTSVGGGPHLLVARLAELSGTELIHVPYRGSVESIAAVLAGNITAMAGSGWVEFVRQGQMRVLSTFGPQRNRLFPEVPTLREDGFDLVMTTPYGFAGPRGMAPEVVQVLHDAFRDALQDPGHLAALEAGAMQVEYLGPADYAAAVARLVAETREVLGRLDLLGKA